MFYNPIEYSPIAFMHSSYMKEEHNFNIY